MEISNLGNVKRFDRNKETAVSATLRHWILRILVPLKGYYPFAQHIGRSGAYILEAFGVSPPALDFIGEEDREPVFAALSALYTEYERRPPALDLSPALIENTERLAPLLGLTDYDRLLLYFVVLLHTDPLLSEAAEALSPVAQRDIVRILAVILNAPETEIRRSLSPSAPLIASQMLVIDRSNRSFTVRCFLNFLTPSFATHMLLPDATPDLLLKDALVAAQPPGLTLADFDYVATDTTILRCYLSAAQKRQQQGVNFLIYGAPGTGKSELARALVEHTGSQLFEVPTAQNLTEVSDGIDRRRAYSLAQVILRSSQAVLLFDEAEDLFGFGTAFFGGDSSLKNAKGWLNRSLETNPVPTFWVTNSIHAIDPAVIRRFDVVVHLRVPPKRKRREIIAHYAEGLVPEETLEAVSSTNVATPGVLRRSLQVVKTIQSELPQDQISPIFEHLIRSTLKAQGHSPSAMRMATALPRHYRPELANADADLTALAERLSHSPRARLCLYGPPGTGKTAFGHWLADHLNRPLLVKRASDLMSMWLGETEKNMARAFEQAHDEGALLQIDEADSFLSDRRGAHASWEVSQVNEMLTQMEHYEGLFIASTNLIDTLDQASIRRFDLKIHFGYLEPIQAWDLFCEYGAALGIDDIPENLRAELTRLDTLTPGDFATLTRQHRFRPIASAQDFLDGLREECAHKLDQPKRPIGFL